MEKAVPGALLTELGSTLDRARRIFESLAESPGGAIAGQEAADRVQELERSIQAAERDREELTSRLVEAEHQLGRLMNLCHGLLNAIGVSTPELERMITLARQSGAAGAKLTGAGGGGSIVALCPGSVADVAEALRRSGYTTLVPGDREQS